MLSSKSPVVLWKSPGLHSPLQASQEPRLRGSLNTLNLRSLFAYSSPEGHRDRMVALFNADDVAGKGIYFNKGWFIGVQ